MTLLEAVRSLEILEVAALSWINIHPTAGVRVASFTIAIILPMADYPDLPEYSLGGGERMFWPDRRRQIDDHISIEDQIQELHSSGTTGNLRWVRLQHLWAIQTHCGSHGERDRWLRSVIAVEGRAPHSGRDYAGSASV
jgi:hypothetical protein